MYLWIWIWWKWLLVWCSFASNNYKIIGQWTLWQIKRTVYWYHPLWILLPGKYEHNMLCHQRRGCSLFSANVLKIALFISVVNINCILVYAIESATTSSFRISFSAMVTSQYEWKIPRSLALNNLKQTNERMNQ